ncbi:MAG: tetratricopeptide repeat protein, partial [Bacteroidales bacterium]|nr:tetratricopeptide repeat protein [Bacteroidales bacterium]
TIRFESPNACNICHDNMSAGWADKFVREWRDRDYQAPVLYNACLINAAREHDWSKLNMMLEALDSNRMDVVFTTSLIRLLAICESAEKWPSIEKKLDHKSPLVRSAAANAMISNHRPEPIKKLLKAAKDKYRVVRLSAASSLSAVPIYEFTTEEKRIVENVLEEYKNSLVTRHDDWSSHYNLGNFYHYQGQLNKAILSYETASRLYDQALEPLINSSIVYSQLNDPVNAERSLKQALIINPESEAANLNLGLLSAETGKSDMAIEYLEKVLEINPESAVSAYNLSILVSKENPDKAIEYSRQAYKSYPDNLKYGYTYAFFLNQNGKTKQATGELKIILKIDPGYIDAIFLLGNIYEESG